MASAYLEVKVNSSLGLTKNQEIRHDMATLLDVDSSVIMSMSPSDEISLFLVLGDIPFVLSLLQRINGLHLLIPILSGMAHVVGALPFERNGFYGTIRDVPRTGWATSATSRSWTFGTADRRR